MRLRWEDRALDELRVARDRTPRQAQAIVIEVEWLAASLFPGMFRRVRGRSRDHVLVVAPYVLLYRVDAEALVVLRVLDGRRERETR